MINKLLLSQSLYGAQIKFIYIFCEALSLLLMRLSSLLNNKIAHNAFSNTSEMLIHPNR